MRIAYIAPYQGPSFLRTRPVPANISLAANVKVELLSEFLLGKGHEIEVLSQGEINGRGMTFYPGFLEMPPVHPDIPIHYSSSLPVRFVNGSWSAIQTLLLFKRRHFFAPFHLLIIYNLKLPQMLCAFYAARYLRLPVILEYEDDAFVNVAGRSGKGLSYRFHNFLAKKILRKASACIGVSPHLLSQLPQTTPKLLLRGVINEDLSRLALQSTPERKNWIVYCGGYARNKGLEQLLQAWDSLDLPDWELHFAGQGEMTGRLEELAKGKPRISFHGTLKRQEVARFLTSAKIGMNPHDLSSTPGNVFAFKIVEYLAAGIHVVTTPMGPLEPELEAGITYLPDNSSPTIASALLDVISRKGYEKTATRAAHERYGATTVSDSLDNLVHRVKGPV